MPASRLRVQCFQHVPFEGLGSVEPWLAAHGAELSIKRLYDAPVLPRLSDFDLLIVMGGPMSVNDEAAYPWLRDEKRFIASAIAGGRHVLGICLGAQLIAASQGAAVRTNGEREIGWHPIELLQPSILADVVTSASPVFHWHGETYDLPAGAVALARSTGCAQQAFALGARVLALQFHLEMTPDGARALIEHCSADLVLGRYVQAPAEMLREVERFTRINAAMDALLQGFVTSGKEKGSELAL